MTRVSRTRVTSGWVSENSIPLRIGSLFAVLLAALVISTIVMAYDLTRNQHRIGDANQSFHRLEVTAMAGRQVGEMRYWLMDLSVSLLTLSERRADESRAELDPSLEQLQAYAPEAAIRIREETETY